jgi:hypothetical protein
MTISADGAHLIIPEEPRVERRTTIFLKKVSETLEQVTTLERLEKAQDNVEISGPATANASDGLGAHAGGLLVLGPQGVVGAEEDEDRNAEECEWQGEPWGERSRSGTKCEVGKERRSNEGLAEGDKDTLAVVWDGLFERGGFTAGWHGG